LHDAGFASAQYVIGVLAQYMALDQGPVIRWLGANVVGVAALVVSVAAVIFAGSQARSSKKQAQVAAAAHMEAQRANAIAEQAVAEARHANAIAELFEQGRAWAARMPKVEFLHWQVEGPFIVDAPRDLREIAPDQVFDPMKDWTVFIGYRVTGTIINHGEQLVYLWPDDMRFLRDDEVGQRLQSSESWRRHLLAGERVRFEWVPNWHLEIWMRRYAYPRGHEYPPDALSPVEGWSDDLPLMCSLSPDRAAWLKLVLNLDGEPVVPRHPRLSSARAERDDVRSTSVNDYPWVVRRRRPDIWVTREHHPTPPDA
jgi:hypothetical protein